MFWGTGFTNWSVTEKCFGINFLSSFFAKTGLLSLFCRVRVESPFPLESPFIYFF